MSYTSRDKPVLSRRDALKTLAALTGAVTLASLPGEWETPIVQVGALPAHAACSFVPGTATLELINQTGGTFEMTLRYSQTEEEACSATLAPGESVCCTELEAGDYFYSGRVTDGDCGFAGGSVSLTIDQVTTETATCEEPS
jgi:hypothetical protein